MSTFSFNENVPATGHTPSQDYTAMQNNYLSTQLILGVDHVTFNTSNPAQGTHLQTTFNQFATPSGPTASGSSVAYPAAGLASSTTAQYYFQNTQATFLISAIRAFASITVPVVAPNTTLPIPGGAFTNSYNIVLLGSTQRYIIGIPSTVLTINLSPNCMTGTNACVLIYSSVGQLSYTLNTNQIVITIPGTLNNPVLVNFAILQA